MSSLEINDFSSLCNYVEGKSLDELKKIAFIEYLSQANMLLQGQADLQDLLNCFDSRPYKEFSANSEYFVRAIEDIKNNLYQYKTVYEQLLTDKYSRKVYYHLLKSRLLISVEDLKAAYSKHSSEYFIQDVFEFVSGQTYIDCGAYSGDTALEFIRVCPEYKWIYLFEADEHAISRARENLKAFDCITFFQNAVGDLSQIIGFENKNNDYSGKICIDSEIQVQMVKLDDCVSHPVSMIKMDVEGYEKQVICGAKRIISEYAPMMAVCIYHLADDLWTLPQLIHSINTDYSFRIFHHRVGEFFDTVLYCIPTKKNYQGGETLSKMILDQRKQALIEQMIVYNREEETYQCNNYEFLVWLKRYVNRLLFERKSNEQTQRMDDLEKRFVECDQLAEEHRQLIEGVKGLVRHWPYRFLLRLQNKLFPRSAAGVILNFAKSK